MRDLKAVAALIIGVSTIGDVANAGIASGLPASVEAVQTRYTATNGSDTGNDCSNAAQPCRTIQYTIDLANTGDVIRVAAGQYDESIYIRKSLTLIGARSTGPGKTVIDGDGSARSITVDGTDTETAPVVTVENVGVSDNFVDDAIFVIYSRMTVLSSDVSNNGGYGIKVGVAGDSVSQLTINSSLISGNSRAGVFVNSGGASVSLAVVSANDGGGIVVEAGATANIDRSTLDSNVGAGVVANGSGSAVTVVQSTISKTAPFPASSGGPRYGAGILIFPGGAVTLTNSTLSGNTGQGLLNIGGAATVTYSTISGTLTRSSSEYPAGGLVQSGAVNMAVSSTIVAAQSATVPDCGSSVADKGYNLDDDGTCLLSAAGSKSHVNAQLGALSNNGGPTFTRAPGSQSPAVNAIPAGQNGCAAATVDQRGVIRLRPSNSK